MLTSMILGILTIVLALAFSLLHLAAAFSAMKQKNYSLGNTCILVGSCLTSLALAIFYFVPVANHSSMDCGFEYRLLWSLLERPTERKATYLAPHRSYNDRYYHYGIIHLL